MNNQGFLTAKNGKPIFTRAAQMLREQGLSVQKIAKLTNIYKQSTLNEIFSGRRKITKRELQKLNCDISKHGYATFTDIDFIPSESESPDKSKGNTVETNRVMDINTLINTVESIEITTDMISEQLIYSEPELDKYNPLEIEFYGTLSILKSRFLMWKEGLKNIIEANKLSYDYE